MGRVRVMARVMRVGMRLVVLMMDGLVLGTLSAVREGI